MRRLQRVGFYLLLVLMLGGVLIACKKQEKIDPPAEEVVQQPIEQEEPEEPAEPEEPEEPIEPEEPVETHEGEVRSRLTALWIPEEYEYSKPYAIMLNNIEYAYPQSGTEEAGIIYEALAEGGITRLMGLYDYVSSDRIGSVRSARHYFVTLAESYDSIFVHFGQTKYADSEFDRLKTQHINGVLGEGNVAFYRDDSINAPHNAFTSAECIAAGMKYKKYTGELSADKVENFKFSTDVEVMISGDKAKAANKITIPFSTGAQPYLTYDADNKVYRRYDKGSQHVDAATQNPLGFTTVLVQFVKEYDIDKNGYQTMELEYSKGEGYFLTGGQSIPIYWSKGNASDPIHYYYDSALTEEIVLNPGKIYIAVYPSYRADKIVIE